jgi:6,7-dimethyl-8-ribityllumazine synthase
MSGLREETLELEAAGRRFAIVAARYHDELVSKLIEGAGACLERHGAAPADVELHRVPGAWELPLALQRLALRGGCDALVALGVVLRGETPHFEYVCRESAAGIARVSLDHGLPIGFGLLTCESAEQAAARAGGEHGNKGWEAAAAALEMLHLVRALERR